MAKRKQKIGTKYSYLATVLKWIDGDTVSLRLDLGFGISQDTVCRLYGVNTPEIHSKDRDEEIRAANAMLRAAGLAPEGSHVQAETVKPREKYGRFLAILTNANGVVIADQLIAEGHGKPYSGGHREPAENSR
jgi:micrococcal nuclease